MKLRHGLAAGAGIFSAVALGIALASGNPARAVAPPADGNYSFKVLAAKSVCSLCGVFGRMRLGVSRIILTQKKFIVSMNSISLSDALICQVKTSEALTF